MKQSYLFQLTYNLKMLLAAYTYCMSTLVNVLNAASAQGSSPKPRHDQKSFASLHIPRVLIDRGANLDALDDVCNVIALPRKPHTIENKYVRATPPSAFCPEPML